MGKAPSRNAVQSTLKRTPLLEWVTAAIGLALIVGAVGVVVADGVGSNGGPPQVAVRPLQILPAGDGWLVRFEARNDGGGAAAEVQVSGVLSRAGQQPEESSATLDYVPGGGRREGGLFFTADPNSGSLELTADGYRQP